MSQHGVEDAVVNRFRRQLQTKGGTLQFSWTVDLEAVPSGTVILNETTRDGTREAQLYIEDGELVYEYVDINSNPGRLRCSVGLDQFSGFDEFMVFLTWEPSGARLHIGPIGEGAENEELQSDEARYDS